jgi:allantoinase
MIELADEPTTLMFHAEIAPTENGHCSGPDMQHPDPTSYSTFLASRPPTFETCAVEEILALSDVAPQLPLHIVHLSAKEAIPILRKARVKGVNITAETCFHYLSFAAEEISDGDTRHKCCPPIRESDNRDALWRELLRHAAADGVIKTVVSDHSPCTPNLKLLPGDIPGSDHAGIPEKPDGENTMVGDFMEAWGGISSVGLGLPILWTELSQRTVGYSVPRGDCAMVLRQYRDSGWVGEAKGQSRRWLRRRYLRI